MKGVLTCLLLLVASCSSTDYRLQNPDISHGTILHWENGLKTVYGTVKKDSEYNRGKYIVIMDFINPVADIIEPASFIFIFLEDPNLKKNTSVAITGMPAQVFRSDIGVTVIILDQCKVSK